MEKKYNYQINGLRAILCILIVLYHFFIRHSGVTISQFVPNANVVWGAFFVLSGYFLSYSDSKRYWISKIKNTIIPYGIAVSAIYLLSRFVYGATYSISIVDLLMNYLALPMITTFFKYVDGAHWYIVYLIYFYFVFWIFNIVEKKCKKDIVQYFMFLFGIGCTISMLLPDGGNTIIKVLRILFNSRLIFIITGYLWRYNRKKDTPQLMILSIILSEFYLIHESSLINALYFIAFLFIFVCCEKGKMNSLTNKYLQSVGTYSLFIYLIHQNIGYIIIDNCQNYWIGAVLATIYSLTVGLFFGVCYKRILVLFTNKH